MSAGKLKRICTFLFAAASVFAITSIFMRLREEVVHTCSCGEHDCDCDNHNNKKWFNVPELLVETISHANGARARRASQVETQAGEINRTAETLKDIFEKIKEKSPSNDSIAGIIVSLVNLQNAVTPESAIDVRSIHFMKSRNQNHMVIDLYTDHYGKRLYEEELNRLWDDIFLADNFWNADFVRVRIKVRDKKTEKALETISCDFDDVRKYLQGEIPLEEFQGRWMRRKPRATKDSGGGSGTIKRVGRK
ncbi:MAG: hypothetical protein A2074_01820 [Candidatus Aquicultor primus]|uniref:Uncharacterized protein n=1 Tax=Candidatus Aquicultor primus TaxID=1797195 RepID=A0A1F2UM28_9ACTN|nr:MAG: hypothetical protein A2074_01820 [Candidatus Aquicultor primus]HCH00220.1 hypothetical protein [Actinomycetota bacterium]